MFIIWIWNVIKKLALLWRSVEHFLSRYLYRKSSFQLSIRLILFSSKSEILTLKIKSLTCIFSQVTAEMEANWSLLQRWSLHRDKNPATQKEAKVVYLQCLLLFQRSSAKIARD